MDSVQGQSKQSETATSGTTGLDIVKLGGAVAALSVLLVFLASFGSTMYAHGLLKVFGFPASAMGVKAASDSFALLAYQRCVMIIVVAVVGFIPTHWKMLSKAVSDRIYYIGLSIILITLGISAMSESQRAFIRLAMEIVAFTGPVLIGITFYLAEGEPVQYARTVLMCLVTIGAFGTNLYLIGAGHANKAVMVGFSEDRAAIESHFGKDATDFSIVTLISTTELRFLIGGEKVGDGYQYQPQEHGFLRFVAEDDAEYFLIEKKDNQVIPFTLRKEGLVSLMFRNVSAISAPSIGH